MAGYSVFFSILAICHAFFLHTSLYTARFWAVVSANRICTRKIEILRVQHLMADIVRNSSASLHFWLLYLQSERNHRCSSMQ